MKFKFRLIAIVVSLTMLMSNNCVAALAQTLTLPETLTEIEEKVFYGDHFVDKIIFIDKAEEISPQASTNNGVEEITLPKSEKKNVGNASNRITELTGDPTKNNEIYDWVVEKGLNDTTVSIWENLVIEDGIIKKYNGQESSIIIPPTDESGNAIIGIGESAFSNCSSLKIIELPDGLQSIDKKAFENCTSLQSINIPDSVTTLGGRIFNGCNNLTSINYPKSLNSLFVYESTGFWFWRTDLYTSPYEGCSTFESIEVPNGVSELPVYMFSGTSFKTVKLPNSIDTIRQGAFEGASITEMSIPSKVNRIEPYTFKSCDKMTKIYLPKKLNTIDHNAFENCTQLEEMFIPNTVESIGADAFKNCPNLKIICDAGSFAETYAFENEIEFESYSENSSIFTINHDLQGTVLTKESNTGGFEISSEAYANDTETLHVTSDCIWNVSASDTSWITVEKISETECLLTVDAVEDKKVYTSTLTFIVGGTKKYTLDIVLDKSSPNEGQGNVLFKIVDASDLTPIKDAHITIHISDNEEKALTTDSEGKVSCRLPVGKYKIDVYATGKQPRNLNINVIEGDCEIPLIGLSDRDIVDARVTGKEMTKDEIIEAGIDISAPGNNHVYKYEVHLEFSANIDFLNMFTYINMDGECVGGDADGNGWFCYNPHGQTYFANPAEEITVYPISETFYIIVYGEVRWLKEMFDVELLVLNNSMTDTLTDCFATINIPKGMALAEMIEDSQQKTIEIGEVSGGEKKSIHWYLCGNDAGIYYPSVHLTGMLQPFEESIDREYIIQDPLTVLAGDAMHLTYRVPDAAYYGKDYIVQAILENVSDKTLYNVESLITGIEEGKITHYVKDGTVKKEIYIKEQGIVAQESKEYFDPGDKIVIEIAIPIFFESEVIQNMKDQLKNGVIMADRLMKCWKQYKTGCEKLSELDGYFKAYNSITEKALQYSNGDLELYDAITGAKKDVNRVRKLWTYFKQTGKSSTTEEEKFSIVQGICNVIQSIPVRFDLIESYVNVLPESTAIIPTTIETVHESGKKWAVNPARYMYDLIIALYGENPDTQLPWPLSIVEKKVIKELMGYEQSVNNLKAVDKELQSISLFTGGTNIRCRAWTENGNIKLSTRGNSIAENGVLNFSGNTILDFTPQNSNDDVIYIDLGDGDIRQFNVDVSAEHVHSFDERLVIYNATDYSPGIEVGVCDVCGDIIDIVETKSCGNHDYEEWVEEITPTAYYDGIRSHICKNCHVLEYEVIPYIEKEIKISVVDADDGKVLEGAHVCIYDGIECIAEWDSNSEAHSIEGLKTNTVYTIKESVMPAYYTGAKDAIFSIDDNGNLSYSGKVSKEGYLLIENKKELPTEIEIVWDEKVLEGIKLKTGDSFKNGLITLKVPKGMVKKTTEGLALNGYNFKDDSFRFEADRPITRIAITGKVHSLEWPGAVQTENGVVWTGSATSVSFGKHIDRITSIEFTLDYSGAAPMPEADFVTPGALKTIEEEAFEGIAAVNVRISDGVKTLGSKAFAKCANLRSIYIPESVKSIADDMLAGCGDVTVYGRSDTVKRFAENNGFEYVEVQ